MNILFTCSGRRNYLLNYFRQELNKSALIVAADVSPDAPTMQEADLSCVVPRVDDPSYISSLKEICVKYQIALLISLNDLELPLLASNRKESELIGTTVLVSSPEIIDICFDKWKTITFLKTNGLAWPHTVLTVDDAMQSLETDYLHFPLIIKPRWGSASIGIEQVNDRKELELAFELVLQRIKQTFLADISSTDFKHSIMIQERLKGDEYGLDIVNDLNGENHAVLCKRKLAMRAGETDRAVTVNDQELMDLGSKIGQTLKHIGNLDCDVFWTGRGNPFVLELNPRFGGGYPFSHLAGANLPRALIAWINGEKYNPEWLQMKTGIRSAKCDRLVQITKPDLLEEI